MGEIQLARATSRRRWNYSLEGNKVGPLFARMFYLDSILHQAPSTALTVCIRQLFPFKRYAHFFSVSLLWQFLHANEVSFLYNLQFYAVFAIIIRPLLLK